MHRHMVLFNVVIRSDCINFRK